MTISLGGMVGIPWLSFNGGWVLGYWDVLISTSFPSRRLYSRCETINSCFTFFFLHRSVAHSACLVLWAFSALPSMLLLRLTLGAPGFSMACFTGHEDISEKKKKWCRWMGRGVSSVLCFFKPLHFSTDSVSPPDFCVLSWLPSSSRDMNYA